MEWLSLLITGFILYKFKQRIWMYSPVAIGAILLLVFLFPYIVLSITLVGGLTGHTSSSFLTSSLVLIVFLVFVIFYLPKIVLKTRRMKIDAISNEDERANALVRFYFDYERKQIGNNIFNTIRGIFNGGKNNGGRIAGAATQGTVNTAGTVLSTTGLPGGGLVKTAMGGVGNLANQGIRAATATANSALNTANAALNNSTATLNSDNKGVDRGISDAELDEVLKKRMTKLDLLQNGLKSLQLDETQISELPPVCLENYYFDENNANLLVAKGKDGIIRTSCFRANCLYFTTEQLCICQYIFDISNGINYQGENTKEYFWQDIIDFTSETFGARSYGQKCVIIKTSSGEYQFAYEETPEIERSIKGMSTYYRDIKKKLVK